MSQTRFITLSPSQLHILSLTARSQGLTVEEYVSKTLAQFFRAAADLKGISAPAHQPQVELVFAGGAGQAAPTAPPTPAPAPAPPTPAAELDLTC